LARAAVQEHQAAIDHLTKALSLAPLEPLPLLFRAEQWAILGDNTTALDDISRFLEWRPGWLPALQVKAQVLLGMNRFEESAKVLDEALTQGRSERLQLLRGKALASAGKLESAFADFSDVIVSNPDNALALLHRGQVSFELNRLDDARNDADKVLAVNPEIVEALFLRALVELKDEHHEEAAAAFDQVLAEEPDHERALLRRGELHLANQETDEAVDLFARALSGNPESSEALCLRAEAYRISGNKTAALADFGAALALEPNLSAAHFGRARIHAESGDRRQALAEIDKAIEGNPDWTEARWFRATLLMSKGETEAAVADLEYLRMETFESALPTQVLEAQALLHSRRHDDAIAACERLLEISPEFWMAWVWHGQAHIYRDGPESECSSFERAVEAQPEQADFIIEQRALAEAAYHVHCEEFPEAIRVLTSVLENNEESLEARMRRGGAYWYSQQLVEAVEDFSAVLKDNPKMTDARAGRGQALAELGDTDAALLDINQAIEESEQDGVERRVAYLLSGRALTAVAQELWENADADLDRSLLLAPGNAWSMYHRGLRYHGNGDRQSAAWCFRVALVLDDPRLPPHKRAKARAYINAAANMPGDAAS
jgi:tetratricopeptide (TPR) repeat protein